MSFWSVLGAVANIAKAGAAVYSAVEQADQAKKVAKIQQQEVLRQQRLAEADAKRTARIRTAQLRAQQGQAGAVTSMGTGGVAGIGMTLQSGLEDLYARSSFNLESIGMQKKAATTEAIGTGISGVLSFKAEDFQTFTSMLGSTSADQSLEQTQAQYPYVARR